MFPKLRQHQEFDFAVRLNPNDLWQRITATSDNKKIAFFSASGFEGNREFLYVVNGNEIKVHLRQRKKGVPPILTMKILPTDFGCRLLGNIAVEKSSWLFLSAMLIIFFIIGAIPTYSFLSNLLANRPLADFTPFDFLGVVFLLNVVILPVFTFLKVRSDTTKLFGWLESLVADSIIKS